MTCLLRPDFITQITCEFVIPPLGSPPCPRARDPLRATPRRVAGGRVDPVPGDPVRVAPPRSGVRRPAATSGRKRPEWRRAVTSRRRRGWLRDLPDAAPSKRRDAGSAVRARAATARRLTRAARGRIHHRRRRARLPRPRPAPCRCRDNPLISRRGPRRGTASTRGDLCPDLFGRLDAAWPRLPWPACCPPPRSPTTPPRLPSKAARCRFRYRSRSRDAQRRARQYRAAARRLDVQHCPARRSKLCRAARTRRSTT